MPVTIKVNGTSNTLVHKMSTGISKATLPDVCKTPSPGGPVPIPYPNIAQSITLSGGTTTVKGDKMMAANKGSNFALSNGDNAGVAGGVKSSTFMKEATWILYSFDVKLQKKNACRLSDKMFHNAENAANLAGVNNGGAGGDEEDEDDKYAEYEEEFEEKQPRRREQRGNVSGNNVVQNAEFQAALAEAAKRAGIAATPAIARIAHDAVSGQGIGGAGRFAELVEAIFQAITK
jgi:Domain of unknown function (DUF4150)